MRLRTWTTILVIVVAGTLVAGAVPPLTADVANAWEVPVPCDFITSGGFVFKDDGSRANFGAHGGCKHGAFWGHVNYVDHGGFMPFGFVFTIPYHVDSTEITGYLDVPGRPNAREICGFARTNAGETNIRFRVHLEDNGEGTNATEPDRFGIRLSNGYLVTTRPLGGGGPGGGNVQLHKGNNSNTGPNPPPDEATMCGDVASPGD